MSLLWFLYGFWRKVFLTLYSTNWPNFIIWLALLLEIFGNILLPSLWSHKILKITLAFLSSRFPTWPEKSGQRFNYLKNKNRYIKKKYLIILKAFIESHKFYKITRTLWKSLFFFEIKVFFNLRQFL